MRADMSGTSQKTAVSSGRSPCAPRKGLPMSERQQLALVMQMCASDKSAAAAGSGASGGGSSASSSATSASSGASSSGQATTGGTTGTGSPPAAGLSPSGGSASSSTAGGSASRSSRSSRNERGETPLHLAAIRGDVALTRRLLSRGADPNCVDFAGWTPLHEASNRGRLQVAEWLLRAGANVNAQGFDADTPLHDAAVNGHVELVQLLLRHGADQHQKNRRGQSPREVAAPRVIACFLQHEQANTKGPSEDSAETTRAATTVDDEEDSKSAASSSEAVKATESAVSESDAVSAAGAGGSPNPSPASTSSSSTFDQTTPRAAAGAGLCEMRRTPAQNKVDKTGSPRVTLRLHQVKGRDEKRANQQQKGTDASSYETRLQFSISMDQGNKGDDVYEFKSSKDATPVTGSPEADGNKGTGGGKEAEVRELSSTSTGGRVGGAPSSPANKEERGKDAETSKRGASEMDGAEEADEENRRKKRKEEKSDSKDSSRNVSGSGRSTGRNGAEKSSKSSTVGSKNGNGKSSVGGSSVSGAANLGDRKSPSNSGSAGNSPKAPSFKPSSAQGDSESDGDDGKKDAVSGSGPKVPPLKIVIPQQSSTEQEQGTRNGKNGNGRHQALPYVVTSSNDSEQGATADKQEAGTSYSGLGKDEKKDAASLQEERSQRVLRSSHRSSNHGGGSGGASMAVGGSSSSLPLDSMANSPSPSKSDDKQETSEVATVSVHPRKRKIKTNKESSVESSSNPPSSHTDVHPHDQPITNCYEMFLNIRRQIEKRRRGLFPVQPKPPQGFKDYLMNQCNYILASNIAEKKVNMLKPPAFLLPALKELFIEQDKERYKLCVQHVVEKEKLVLSVEQEILRVHGRAARALANQSLPFSVCTMLKDEEVYNVITPEQEEKDRNARSRYNGRLFLSWLQDVDDKWEKIKESMVSRHHNEAYALHAVQKMNWEWKLKELALCDFNENPKIDSSLVPFIHVSDDFDLLPA